MKNLKFSALLLALVALVSFSSQAQTFKRGDKILNAGIGLLYFGAYANAEFAIEDNIGIGPMVGYTYYNSGLLTGYSGDYSYGQFRVGARGAYHLGDVLNLGDNSIDPYVAVGAGLLFDRNNYTYNTNTGNVTYGTRTTIFINPRAGARFPLSNNLSGFGEVGWGASWVTAGVSFGF